MGPATASKEAQAFEALLWFAAIVFVVIGAVVAFAFIRRRLVRAGGAPVPFTLDELRRMRDRGDVTAEEFESIKRRMLHTG